MANSSKSTQMKNLNGRQFRQNWNLIHEPWLRVIVDRRPNKKKSILFPGKSVIGEGKWERPGSKFLLAKIDNIALRHNDFTHNDFTSALL